MEKPDRNRLVAILGRLSLSLPKDLSGVCLDVEGQQVSTFDVYERALDKYLIDRIERACDAILRGEKFFPTPATIIEYYNRIPPPDREQITKETGETERTPEQMCRSELIRHYWLAPYWIEDEEERAEAWKTMAREGQAGLERYIKKHQNDNTKGR